MQRSLLSLILDWEGLDLRLQTSSVCKRKQMQQEEIVTATASSQSLWRWKLRNVTAAIELWGQPGYAMSLLDEDAREVKTCDKAADALSGMGSAYTLVFQSWTSGMRDGLANEARSRPRSTIRRPKDRVLSVVCFIKPDMKFLKLFPQNMFLKENSIKPTNKMFPPPGCFLKCTSFAIGKCSFSHFIP